MDTWLYQCLQERNPTFPVNQTALNLSHIKIETKNENHFYSPFDAFSIKMLIMDHTSDYILIPMANIFDKATHFSKVFYFVTPNMISLSSILPALLSAKLVSSNSLFHRQIAVLLFEFRTFLDSLDGVVFRERHHIKGYVTDLSSWGTTIDGIADAIGFIAIFFGCCLYLTKNHSRTAHNQNGGLLEQTDINGRSTKLSKKQLVFQKMTLCFLLSVFTSIAWNFFLQRFQNMFEQSVPTTDTAIVANSILKSNFTWMFMWIWRVVSPHGAMDIILLSIFIDKFWIFNIIINEKGLAFLSVLTILTELYCKDIEYILQSTIR